MHAPSVMSVTVFLNTNLQRTCSAELELGNGVIGGDRHRGVGGEGVVESVLPDAEVAMEEGWCNIATGRRRDVEVLEDNPRRGHRARDLPRRRGVTSSTQHRIFCRVEHLETKSC